MGRPGTDTARQVTDDNIIRHIRFACWVTKATATHQEYVIIIVSHGNSGYSNAPQCHFKPICLSCPNICVLHASFV